MKKRLWSILLVGVMVVSMAGCGSSTNESASKEDAAETAAPAEEGTESTSAGGESGLIVYTQKTMNQYFHVALQEKVEEAVLGAGYEVEVANCNNDSTLQNDQFRNFISKNPKAIIANAVDSDALNDVTNEAMEAGIPVIMVDNPASTAVVSGSVKFDNVECGRMAAERIVELLTEKYGAAQGRLVNVYGAMSSECWRLRKEGFDEVISQYPDIEYIEVPGEGDRAKSQEALTNVIAQYNGEIDAVHCPSDDPGLGCAEALQIAGLWYPVGDENHVILVTGDGEPDAVQYLKDGYYDAIIVEDAYAYGPIAMELLKEYVFQGEPVPTSGTYTNEDYYWKTAEFMEGETGPILQIPPYAMDASNVNESGHWGAAALEASE